MERAIVQARTGVTLLGGGAVTRADVAEALTIAPDLVAADGGGDRALELGLRPRAVIGDLDSLSARAREALAPDVHHIPEQDSTDFGKCLRLVEAPFYLALGFAGRRLDHTLSALSEIARRDGQRIVMLAEEDVIFRAPPELRLDLPAGARVSIMPFGPVRGRSEGLRWPIDGLDLTPAGRIGTSNLAEGPVTLRVEGSALVLVARSQLPAALCALGLQAARGGSDRAPSR